MSRFNKLELLKLTQTTDQEFEKIKKFVRDATIEQLDELILDICHLKETALTDNEK